MDQVLDDLRSYIASRMREGFESVHDIIENATDYALERHGRDDMLPGIKRLTAELLAELQAEQDGWLGPTDCDSLDEAFAVLNRQGVVARQDFSCCNNCGFTEIWDEVEKEEKHQAVKGYVFYHMQCTARAIESGQLLMAYGSVEDDPETLKWVANKVLAELRRVGLRASWQGTEGDPIVVDGIVWRGRRK
jgi:hypothetical protein